MSDQPQEARESKVTRLRRRVITRIVAGVGAGLAALISLSMASYSLSQPKPVPEIAPGVEVDAGRWRIAIIDARFSEADANGANYFDRRRALKVDMKLTNLAQESGSSYQKLVSYPAQPAGMVPPTFQLTRDGSLAGGLHPDMPEYVTAYWFWSDSEAVPGEVQLFVGGEFFKPRDNLYGAPGWFPAEPTAHIRLPVKLEAAGS